MPVTYDVPIYCVGCERPCNINGLSINAVGDMHLKGYCQHCRKPRLVITTYAELLNHCQHHDVVQSINTESDLAEIVINSLPN